MTWVSYPGRSNGTAAAVEVEFANPGAPRKSGAVVSAAIAAPRAFGRNL